MATTGKGNNKTARSISDISTGVEGGNDSKRPRTATTAAATASVDKEGTINNNNPSHYVVLPDIINSASESNNAVTANSSNEDDEDNNRELPTPAELSKELSKIVSDRYSRDESVRALENLSNWALTGDNDFLKLFYTYGGIVRVVDFLKSTMNDVNCKGSIRMECIKDAADVIAQIAYQEENFINKEIVTKIVATLLDCDGINTLIAASEEYTGGKDVPQLKAVRSVWRAFRNLMCMLRSDTMIQDTAIIIFGTGIDIMSQLKSSDGNIASITLDNVFCSLNSIVENRDYVTKKYFQDENILSKCLEVFKKNGTWNLRSSEDLMENAVDFFDNCRIEYLLDESLDYKMILPLLVVALKKFPSNDEIRRYVVSILDYACSSEANKETILRSGVTEPLILSLATDKYADGDEKKVVRALISKIIA